jgi:hypothetical protein
MVRSSDWWGKACPIHFIFPRGRIRSDGHQGVSETHGILVNLFFNAACGKFLVVRWFWDNAQSCTDSVNEVKIG